MGAFNEEGEGVSSLKSSVNMPLGTPLLNYGGNLVYLNSRTFTAAEAKNIFEIFKIIADRNTQVDKTSLFKYLHKIIYMANPEKDLAATDSSITIDGPSLRLGRSTQSIALVPEILEENKSEILRFLQGVYHAVKNSELLRIANNSKASDLEFVELKAEDGKVTILSTKTPEGHSRATQPLSVNIAVPQQGERPIIQKYSVIDSYEFDISKFKPVVSEPTVQTITSDTDAIKTVLRDAKSAGFELNNLEELRKQYEEHSFLSDSDKSMLMGAVDFIMKKVQEKDKQQEVQKTEEKSPEVERSITYIEHDFGDPIGVKKFGFIPTARDEAGNITDINPIGSINDDNTITPYKDPAKAKGIILNALAKSRLKEDETTKPPDTDDDEGLGAGGFEQSPSRYRLYNPANGIYQKANLQEEFKEFRRILPDFFTLQTIDRMIKTSSGGLAWGALHDNMVYIYKNAEVGTTYHEAFEAIWYHFLTGKEQQDIYNEFISRAGEFVTYKGQRKSYSNASVKEAKEQLAEEFKDFKISGRIPSQPKNRSFFRKLLDFIKWLLGLETSERNRLFKAINKGYYRNYASSIRGPMEAPEYSYYRESGLDEFSEAVVQDTLQAMTAKLFGEIFGENTDIITQLEEDFEVTARSIYDELKHRLSFYMEDKVQKKGTLTAEYGVLYREAQSEDERRAIVQQVKSIRTLWSRIKDNWDAFVREHQRYLRAFNVEFVIDDEGNIDLSEEDYSPDENKSMTEYDRDIMQYDAKNSASTRVKLLIFSIADSEWIAQATRAGMSSADAVRDKIQSSSLGLPKLVQYAKLFNYLLHSVAGTNTFYDIWETFTGMVANEGTRKAIDANLRKLMNRLKFDNGFEDKTPADAKMILSLEGTLSKQKPAFFRQFTDYQRNTYFKTTVLNSKIDQLKSVWIGSITGSDAVISSEGNRFMFSSTITGIRDNVDFLNKLGIDFTKEDYRKLRGRAITRFNDAVNKIRALVEKAAREKTAIPIISSRQIDFDSRLNDLAEIYVTYITGEDTQSQHPNLDSEPTSNFVLNNFVSTMINDANNADNRDEFISRQDNGYLEDIFHNNSLLLNEILFDRNGNKGRHVDIGVVEGRETWDSNNKSASKMTEAERQLYEINNNINGVFYTLLPADAKTEWAIKVGTYFSSERFFGDDTSRSNEITAFANQMYKWLGTEIALAKDYENRRFIDALNRVPKGENRPVGKSLRFFKDILPKDVVDDVTAKVIDGDSSLGDILSSQRMRDLMREYVAEKTHSTINNLIDWKVLSQNNDEEYRLFGFDKGFLNKVFGDKSSYTQQELERLVFFREMNYVVNNIEMHKFFFGDPAQYKDELKRIKSFLSGREYTHIDTLNTSEGFNQWANINLNKAGNIELSMQDPGYQQFNTLTVYDVLYESASIDEIQQAIGEKAASPYTEGNEDDAGAYMSDTAYREMMWKGAGRWTSAQERQFQWEKAWERNDKAEEGKYTYSSEALRKYDEDLLKTEPDEDVAFPILKLVHSGIQTWENIAISSLDKASWAPLFYRWYKGRNLGKLYDQMQKYGVDYVRMESAHKVGIQNPSSLNLYDENGDFNEKAFQEVETEAIPIKQIGVQVEQAKKEKGQTEGSQLRKIAIGDLMSNGVPIDFLDRYKTEQEAYIAWDNLETLERKREVSPIFDRIYKHNQALIDLTTTRSMITMRRLGMKENEDGSIGIPDKKLISDFILAELERRELPRNIAIGIQVSPETRDFTQPLESNPQYSKIRAIIYSVLEKTLSRPKVSGGQKTMLSITGMETDKRIVKKVVNEKPVYTSTTLKFYKSGTERTEACEVMLPYWFGKRLREAHSGKTKEEILHYLNNTQEGRELLKGVGFRIPTQGLNSVDFFIVKDFLPEQMGDVIILPAEITAKAGSDFDIDKLNVYLRNYYVQAESGLPKLLRYKGSEKATKEYIAELIQNQDISAGEWRAELERFIAEEIEGYEEGGLFETAAAELFSNERLIQDFLENRQDNLIDMYYLKALENQYFDTIEDLVSLPQNYSRLVTPNDASELKGYRDKILKLKGQEVQPLGDYGKLLDSVFMMKERQAYMASKQVVGTSAVSQTAHAVSQNLPGGLLVEDPSIVARFPHNEIDGKISLSGLYIHGSNRLISNINSQTTDGGVDVAKDKFLAEMGITQDTLSTFLTLVRMGATPWWAVLYLNQPSVQEFLKIKAISTSVSQISTDVKREPDWILLSDTMKLFGDPGRNNSNIAAKPPRYSIEQMETMIRKYSESPESLTEEEKTLQMMILDDFSRYNRPMKRSEGYNALAWELFHFYQGYNWDTARVNDPNLVRLKNLKYGKANELMVTPARKVMDNTFIGEMRTQVLRIDEGLRSAINIQAGAAGSVLDQLARDVFNMRTNEKAKQAILLNVELSMVDYSIQTSGIIEGIPINALLEALIMSSNPVAKYVEALKNHEDKRLSSNPFLSNLLPIVDKRPGFPSYINLVERDFDTYTSNVWTDSIRELKDDATVISINNNSDNDKTVGQIYKRLILTSLFLGGSKRVRWSYGHLLPAEDYSAIIRDSLKNINLTSFIENLVLYRIAWNNPIIVPNAELEFLGDDYSYFDPFEKPVHVFFQDEKIMRTLGELMGTDTPPAILTPIAWKFRHAKVIKIETFERDDKGQVVGRNIRLFRRVDVLSLEGIVPLQYDRNRLMFVEINAWGDGGRVQEYYSTASPSVLPFNNNVMEADDEQILYTLYRHKIPTNAAQSAIGRAVERFEEDEGTEIDNDGNTPSPVEPKGPMVSEGIYTNYSGGAQGADLMWDQIGREFGVVEHIHYRPEDYHKSSQQTKVKIEEAVVKAAKVLGRPSKFKGDDLVKRNWFQVNGADAIFAISRIVEPNGTDKGFINNSGKQVVSGGTGWAVEMAIQQGKPVHVFDMITNKWYTWNISQNKFVIEDIPLLTRNFAGIGSRELTEQGMEAIRQVYQKSNIKSSSSQSTSLRGFLRMQPDNIQKIKDRTKTITNRKELLEDGIYILPDETQVEMKLLGKATADKPGTTSFVTFETVEGRGIEEDWEKDDFAKAEGFLDWEDFEKNNKFSANFVRGSQSRYVYQITFPETPYLQQDSFQEFKNQLQKKC